MAYLQDDDENNVNAQGMNQPNQAGQAGQDAQGMNQQQQQQAGGTALGQTSAQPTPNQQAVGQANKVNPKAGSGTFTNLRQYVSANQGNRIASAASQNIARTAQGAEKGIQQGMDSFGRKLEQGSLQNRDTAVQDVRSMAQQARQVTAPAQQAQAPQQPAQTPQQNQQIPAPSPELPPGVEMLAPIQTMAEPTVQNQQTPPTSPTAPEQSVQTAQDMYGNLLQDFDTKRFQDVINAKYQGPDSLRQAGIYDSLYGRTQKAQEMVNQAETAGGREDLLKNLFGRDREYTRGQNKLDALLLNTSPEGVQSLLQEKERVGSLQDKLGQAQSASQNMADQRKQELRNIVNDSRGVFTEEQKAEALATEQRIDNVVGNWNKLPDHFKNLIEKNKGGPLTINEMEQALLGVQSGEGFYNLGSDLIKTNQAERDRLVSRDEQLRQATLAQLAGLDQSNLLNRTLRYEDASRAGTQSALDALNTQGIRNALDEAERNFRNTAAGTTLTGQGHKQVSRGNAFGKKTQNYYAETSANVGELLRKAGYDMNNMTPQQTKSLLDNQDLLRSLGQQSLGTEFSDEGSNVLGSTAQGAAQGAAMGASIGSIVPGVGTAIGAAAGTGVGATLGAYQGSGTIDPYQQMQDMIGELGLGGVANTAQQTRNAAGDLAGVFVDNDLTRALGLGSLGSGIKSAISGIDTKAMKQYGDSMAQDFARQDLERKYGSFLQGQGFDNRLRTLSEESLGTNIADTQSKVQQQQQQLQQQQNILRQAEELERMRTRSINAMGNVSLQDSSLQSPEEYERRIKSLTGGTSLGQFQDSVNQAQSQLKNTQSDLQKYQGMMGQAKAADARMGALQNIFSGMDQTNMDPAVMAGLQQLLNKGK